MQTLYSLYVYQTSEFVNPLSYLHTQIANISTYKVCFKIAEKCHRKVYLRNLNKKNSDWEEEGQDMKSGKWAYLYVVLTEGSDVVQSEPVRYSPVLSIWSE